MQSISIFCELAYWATNDIKERMIRMKKTNRVIGLVLALLLTAVLTAVSATAAGLNLNSSFKGLDAFKNITNTKTNITNVTDTKKSEESTTACVTSEVVTSEAVSTADEASNAADKCNQCPGQSFRRIRQHRQHRRCRPGRCSSYYSRFCRRFCHCKEKIIFDFTD